MEPYAMDGDYAVSTRLFLKVRTGDVLVFRSPKDGMILIKRVKSLEDSQDGPRFFMEGDNRMRSVDSNAFGSISRDSVIGKIIFIARKK